MNKVVIEYLINLKQQKQLYKKKKSKIYLNNKFFIKW